MHAQDGDGTVEVIGPIAGTRVVESDDEIALRCGVKPPFDRFPWGEQIGQRNGAEIMAEDGAGSGGGSLESGNAGNDLDSDAAGAIGVSYTLSHYDSFEPFLYVIAGSILIGSLLFLLMPKSREFPKIG